MDLDDDGIQRYMYDEFFNALSNEIPEYALGHSGTNPSIQEIREGIKSIFKARQKDEEYDVFLNKLYNKGFFGGDNAPLFAEMFIQNNTFNFNFLN